MSGNLQYRWADQEDLGEVQAFLSRTYGADSLQAAPGRCRWLFFENPLGLHISLCHDAGQLVASCGHLAQNVTIDGKEILAGFGIDFMVDRAWRRRGIGRRFLQMRLERFHLGLSLGQSNEMGALYRSLGACDMGPMQVGIFRRRPSLGANPKLVARNLAVWARGLSGLRSRGGTTVRPREVSQLDHPHPAWFNWRYGPSSVYGDYFGLEPGNPAGRPGLAVCRSIAGYNLVVEIRSPEEFRAEFLAALGRTGGKAETRIMFTGRALGEDCRKAGFLIRPHGARVIGMTGDRELSKSLASGMIELTAGAADGDLLRLPEPSA